MSRYNPAATFEITERRRPLFGGLADIENFGLCESGQTAVGEILENPHITLYSLDLQNGRAVFVETPPDVELDQAPFFYMAQYENAVRVLTISVETMVHLAQSVSLDDERLVFIHSVGRAGSTLASQIFAQVEGVVNISEPDALSVLVAARYFQPDNKAALLPLLDATIRLLCKTPAQTAWVIKGRSFIIELADWLHELYPRTRNLFLYRDGESWLRSAMRAYHEGMGRTEEEIWEADNQLREYWSPLVPLAAGYDPDEHLTAVGFYCLMWLSVMDRYVDLNERGIEMLAIRYTNWRSRPRETAVAMLEYCDCCPSDLTFIDEVLANDSQAGSHLSKEGIQQRGGHDRAINLDELNRHLQNHPVIRTADFEVANTWQEAGGRA